MSRGLLFLAVERKYCNELLLKLVNWNVEESKKILEFLVSKTFDGE